MAALRVAGLMAMDDASEFMVRTARLRGLTLVAANTRRQFARHSHAVYGIGVMDAGGQTSASGRGVVQAVQGEVITVNPGEVHDGVPMSGEKRCWRMLYLDAALWSEERSSPEWTAPVLRDNRVAALCNALFGRALRDDDVLEQEALLVALLRCAPSTSTPTAPARLSATAPQLQRARERLADHGQALPSLGELARDAGLSRYQFLRAFTVALGLPPHAWALQQRVAQAEAQLASGLPLVDVALGAGFADQSHMTRTFRRFRGYTPGQYAQAHR